MDSISVPPCLCEESGSKLFFCADLGTSSLKAALIDSSGSLHAFTRVPYTNGGDTAGGGQSTPASWLGAFYLAAEQLAAAKRANASLCPVSAIVISGNGPTLVPVNEEDPETSETLTPLHWYDSPPPATDPVSGPLPGSGCSSLFLPKVKRFMDADPDAYAKTRYLFSPQEWLSWKLGARPVTVIPHEGYVPYYWDEEQCRRFGADLDRFPPFVKMGELIGEYKPAHHRGMEAAVFNASFLPGTPLIAGAADFIMALIGTGTLEPGTACDRTGSSEGINLCVTKEDAFRQKEIFTTEDTVSPTETAGRRFPSWFHGEENSFCTKTPCNSVVNSSVSGSTNSGPLRVLPHAIEGLWNLGAVIPQSGSLFDEYRVSSGQTERPYGELTAEILADSSHPGRPILETMAANFVQALELLESSGNAITELVLSGGQCADPKWNQYKADVSGRTLKVPEIIHAELAGNAVLAAAALEGGSIREKAAGMIRVGERYGKQGGSICGGGLIAPHASL